MSSSLSPADIQRLDTLFERAADLPPSEQANFVERECGTNGALRDELGRLLAGLAGEDVLSRMRPGTPLAHGTRIGPYTLLERIGMGGMGEVYAAQQHEPIERKVAVKIIKPGMDSAEVVARFHAERQALARMAHPNVAQVFDGGATEDGRPYFVMEYVAGASITEYCDRRKLSTQERLELFLQICDGVQHAHQKGIIHRDLKPSNLLVAQQGDNPYPKIIDFGVARATTGRLVDRTLHTMVGQIVGTLDYMSPEQADPSGVELDTRSDIYSLGVVLYQLVSGLLPFEHATQAETPMSEIVRTIREMDPPTPSTRLRRQTGTAVAVAPLHGTDERSLVRQLAGDLDWICLKALEKDPARRYASAAELADDVRRHLAHEPVLAGRPGALYRARKFVRRHRIAVGAGLLITVGASAGIFGVVSGRIEARTSDRVAAALRPHADAYQLRQLMAESDALWPAEPRMIPALEAWEAKAREFLGRLEEHRALLAEVEAGAPEWTPEQQERDRATHPEAETLAHKQAELEAWEQELDRLIAIDLTQEELGLQYGVHAETRIAELEPEIAGLQARVALRRTWFPSDEDQAWHDVLDELVRGLDALLSPGTGLLIPEAISSEHGWSVAKRLAFARGLEAGFAPGGDYEREWRDVLPAIHEDYPELDLSPQMGLLPLGPDPASGLWEFAHLASGEPALRGPDGALVRDESTGLVLVLLPGGTFFMGSQGSDPNGPNFDPDHGNRPYWWREVPVVEEEVSPFFLSKYEMTQAQWVRACGENPSLIQRYIVMQAPNNPVNSVTWTESRMLTNRLGLVLPTERMWEYAARGGTQGIYWTEAPLGEAANLGSRGPRQPDLDGYRAITTVGSFPANPFGLHDVIGNVSEWCFNFAYEYGTATGSDPETIGLRAFRGGNAKYPAASARMAMRRVSVPEGKDGALGLRPARPVESY